MGDKDKNKYKPSNDPYKPSNDNYKPNKDPYHKDKDKNKYNDKDKPYGGGNKGYGKKKNTKNTRRPIKNGVRRRRSITKNTTDTVTRPIMRHSMSLSQLLPHGSIWHLSMKSKLSAEFDSLRDLINS